ncbi:transcriptional regulator, AraC family [Lutibacter oricola]|uniref:Transcriptional regulator, AraC family n=1 Tax=Lutibacter oricola TaxID=762486 RepID=A0A1H2RG71_9FLAO|nr:helix-turn-helix domain-containing protein [Lutibacter oricola]SDW18387.1 transcriptional regulator, AraC family [Lutibacter oricola]
MYTEHLLSQKLNSINFTQNLFEQTNVGFFAKDINGKIISLNSFMLSIYGVDKKSIVLGKTDFDFLPDHFAKSITKDDFYVLEKGKAIIDKIEMVPFIDFKTYWLKTSKHPIFDNKNNVVGLIGITSKLNESGTYTFKNKNLIKVLKYMEANIDKKISLDQLCDIALMSKTSLLRHFKDDFQISPMAYLKKVRLHLACKMLRNSNKDLLSIAYACGYYDQSHFNKDFKAILNETPKKYKARFEAIIKD